MMNSVKRVGARHLMSQLHGRGVHEQIIELAASTPAVQLVVCKPFCAVMTVVSICHEGCFDDFTVHVH